MFTFTGPVDAVIETLEEDDTFAEVTLSTARSIARQSLRDSQFGLRSTSTI